MAPTPTPVDPATSVVSIPDPPDPIVDAPHPPADPATTVVSIPDPLDPTAAAPPLPADPATTVASVPLPSCSKDAIYSRIWRQKQKKKMEDLQNSTDPQERAEYLRIQQEKTSKRKASQAKKRKLWTFDSRSDLVLPLLLVLALLLVLVLYRGRRGRLQIRVEEMQLLVWTVLSSIRLMSY